MSNYLIHYGVKGMKWGVRKEIETYGREAKNYATYIPKKGLVKGYRQAHAKNVLNRLNEAEKAGRTKRMNNEQKQSYEISKKYWSNRAEGKSHRQSGGRNILKRSIDDYRSKSVFRRAGSQFVRGFVDDRTRSAIKSTIASTVGADYSSSNEIVKDVISNALSTAASIGVDELANRTFGHY